MTYPRSVRTVLQVALICQILWLAFDAYANIHWAIGDGRASAVKWWGEAFIDLVFVATLVRLCLTAQPSALRWARAVAGTQALLIAFYAIAGFDQLRRGPVVVVATTAALLGVLVIALAGRSRRAGA
jgi:hypothetical protein